MYRSRGFDVCDGAGVYETRAGGGEVKYIVFIILLITLLFHLIGFSDEYSKIHSMLVSISLGISLGYVMERIF